MSFFLLFSCLILITFHIYCKSRKIAKNKIVNNNKNMHSGARKTTPKKQVYSVATIGKHSTMSDVNRVSPSPTFNQLRLPPPPPPSALGLTNALNMRVIFSKLIF